jgi:hypothetical protein
MARNESAIRAVTTPDHGWRVVVVVDKVVRSIPPERPCHSLSERANARKKKEYKEYKEFKEEEPESRSQEASRQE